MSGGQVKKSCTGLPWWLSGKKKKKILLTMQETQVRSLVREDPKCHEATKPMGNTIEPVL